MPKYKVGDKVKVVDDLGKKDGGYMMEDGSSSYCTVYEMERLSGKVVTISQVTPHYYHIKEDTEDCFWTDEMFSGYAAQYHVGDKVLVREDLDYLHAPAMRDLAGCIVKITRENVVDICGSEPGFAIAEDDEMWVWHADDFAGIVSSAPPRPLAKIRMKREESPVFKDPSEPKAIKIKTERKSSKMNFNFKKMLKQYMPHAIDDGSVALSISGDIAYRRKDGDYVFYDPESKSINNCMDLVLGSDALDKMVFVMPVKDIAIGDVVVNGGKYIYITNITSSGAIKGVSLESGRTATLVKEINTVMGYCPYAKVTSLFTMMTGKGSTGINPAYMMWLLNADGEDDLFTTIAIMTAMGGNSVPAASGGLFGGMNPLMLMALSGDGDGESDGMMKMFMLSQMMGGGLMFQTPAVPASAPVFAAAPVAGQAPTVTPAAAPVQAPVAPAVAPAVAPVIPTTEPVVAPAAAPYVEE